MKKQHVSGTAQMILYGELILALLVLTAVGARLYGSTLAAREAHSHKRLALSYMQSQAQGYPGDRLSVFPGPEGDMLVLRESAGDYETKIYVYDGELRSEFSHVGAAAVPQNSQAICALEELKLSMESSGLLHITADGMEGYICSNGGMKR